MSKNLNLVARRILAGGLAAAALTTGVGLATSGIAEAAPSHLYTCMTNIHGTVTVTDHGKSSTLPINQDPQHCVTSPSDLEYWKAGFAKVSDPNNRVTEGQARAYISSLDGKTGAVKVTLAGQVFNNGSSTVDGYNSVALTIAPGSNKYMHEITRDSAGRTVDTMMQFDLVSPTF